MEQLTIFDTEPTRNKGFLHRWHLYDGDENRFTVIPGATEVTILGRFDGIGRIGGKHTEVMSYGAYEVWKKDNNYEERETETG